MFHATKKRKWFIAAHVRETSDSRAAHVGETTGNSATPQHHLLPILLVSFEQTSRKKGLEACKQACCDPLEPFVSPSNLIAVTKVKVFAAFGRRGTRR